MITSREKSRSLAILSVAFLTLALSACGSSEPVAPKASQSLEQYIISESQGIANAWDSTVQPLLNSADTASTEWRQNFVSTLTAFSLLTANASGGIPANSGSQEDEAALFKTAVDGLTKYSTDAWMALQNNDASGLDSAMGSIKASFGNLTTVINNLSNAN